MALLGTIASLSTETLNIQNLPEFLQFGTEAVDTVGLEVTVSGRLLISVTNPNLWGAINGVGMAGNLSRTQVIFLAQIANGGKGNENVEIRVTNSGLADLPVYGYSTSKNDGTAVLVNQSTVVANSNDEFKGFESLAFVNANVDTVQVEFADGWSDRFTVEELGTLLGKLTPALVTGNTIVDTCTTIDNRLGFISSIRVYAADTGNVAVASKKYTYL